MWGVYPEVLRAHAQKSPFFLSCFDHFGEKSQKPLLKRQFSKSWLFNRLALLASGRGCRHQAAAAAVSPHLPPEEHQLALYLGVVRVPLLLLSCYNPQHLEKRQGVATVRDHQLFNKLWLSRTLSFGNRKWSRVECERRKSLGSGYCGEEDKT